MIINTNVITINGKNSQININNVDEFVFVATGFEKVDEVWVFRKYLTPRGRLNGNEIKGYTFNMRIFPDKTYEIKIIDEYTELEYNYQTEIIESNTEEDVSDLNIHIHKKVQSIMKEFRKVGIISNYRENDFI